MIEEECKNPLAWWKVHEVQFPNTGFVVQQISKIIGFLIELEKKPSKL